MKYNYVNFWRRGILTPEIKAKKKFRAPGEDKTHNLPTGGPKVSRVKIYKAFILNPYAPKTAWN